MIKALMTSRNNPSVRIVIVYCLTMLFRDWFVDGRQNYEMSTIFDEISYFLWSTQSKCVQGCYNTVKIFNYTISCFNYQNSTKLSQ